MFVIREHGNLYRVPLFGTYIQDETLASPGALDLDRGKGPHPAELTAG